MKKIGFVIPWYHKDIPGGAEQELRGIVKHLHEKNVPVEILTTCVKEFSADWTENYMENSYGLSRSKEKELEAYITVK